MNRFTFLILALIAALGVGQKAIATTYSGSYYLEFYDSVPIQSQHNKVGTAYNIIGFPHVNVTNMSVTLTGGVVSGCSDNTNVPYVWILGAGAYIGGIPLTNGVQKATVPVSLTATNTTFELELEMPAGSTCQITGGVGGAQNLQVNVEMEYQLGSTDLYPHLATSYFQMANPAVNVSPSFQFDNSLSHGWQPITDNGFSYGISAEYNNFSWGSENVGYLYGCQIPLNGGPYWGVTSGSLSTGKLLYLNTAGGMAQNFWSSGATSGNTPVSLTASFNTSDGCTASPMAFVQFLTYGVDSSNVGPFYLTSFVNGFNPSLGVTTVSYFTPSTQTGITLKSLRARLVDGSTQTGCTTYPTVGIMSGTTSLASGTFSSSGGDAVWTGTKSVSSGSEIKFVVNPGVGCTSIGQFNITASYSSP